VKMNVRQAVELYLKTRRSFGFALVQVGVELGSLVRYARQIGHRGPLTASLAIRWVHQPQQATPAYRAHRLALVRRLAEFSKAYDRRTQIPPHIHFAPTYRRRPVHIYSAQQLQALSKASAQLGRIHPLRGSTFRALVGLLYCTGLRIGEALGLTDADIDWSAGILTIRLGKNRRPRLIPVHPSTLQALRGYRALRNKAIGSGVPGRFFVTFRGKPLGYCGVSAAFRKLCRQMGWTQPPIPRLHDLRHTFAVGTLLAWYRRRQPVSPKLWTLSTYLGHRHLADTYWYLSAVPELMQLCQERFAQAQTWASKGGPHD